jgi:hypothetical protein
VRPKIWAEWFLQVGNTHAGALPRVPCRARSPLKQSTQLLYNTAAATTAPADRLTRKEKDDGSLKAAAMPSIASSDALHSATSAELTEAASFGSMACHQHTDPSVICRVDSRSCLVLLIMSIGIPEPADVF